MVVGLACGFWLQSRVKHARQGVIRGRSPPEWNDFGCSNAADHAGKENQVAQRATWLSCGVAVIAR